MWGLCAALKLAASAYRRGQFLSPVKCVLAGVFVSAVLLFMPINWTWAAGDFFAPLKCVLLSVHSVMRLFVLDGEFDGMAQFAASLPQAYLRRGYSILAAALYVLAPALSFGFVLSFFKNVSAYHNLLFRRASKICVFSELNEQSLALAGSIKRKSPQALIVFTDVFENNEESIFELCERARELKAICFKRDIADVNWRLRRRAREVLLFVMGEDESENIEQSIRLIEDYGAQPNFRLFVFSSGVESEVLFRALPGGGMRVRRVNAIRSLVNQTLYQTGQSLFAHAIPGDGVSLISVVLIGLGQYGTEMLKALSWFCQMDGYQVEINVYDKDPLAESRFSVQCPELMSPRQNGAGIEGDAQYRIAIHSGVDVDTAAFANDLATIKQVSHVFVALGEDGKNTKTAINARILCARSGQHPDIQAVVYHPMKKRALEHITDYRGHAYDIQFIGDLLTTYSEENIIDSQLEDMALKRHLKWGREEDFWAYEFNYRSSVAAAIHLQMRILCGIPGADKEENELSPEERLAIEKLEHRRWNAYMRSEGYVFSGSVAPESRNDLAKMHNDLVPFEQLSEEEKRKDSKVGSI